MEGRGGRTPSIRKTYYLYMAIAISVVCLLGYIKLPTPVPTYRECVKVIKLAGSSYDYDYDHIETTSRQPDPVQPPASSPGWSDPNEGDLWAVHPSLKKMYQSLTPEQQIMANEIEQDFYREATRSYNPSCGIWQEEYRKRHIERTTPEKIRQAFMMWKRDGSVPKHMQYVSHYCPADRDCGGVADHVFGAFSLFAYCLLNDKVFLIDWPEEIWIPEKFNWNATQVVYPVLNQIARERQEDPESYWFTRNLLNWNPERLDAIIGVKGGQRTTAKDELDHDNAIIRSMDTVPFVRILANRGALLRHLRHDETRNQFEEWGLHSHNIYKCVWDFLFPLKGSVLTYLNKYRSILQHPDVFSIAVHIRNGDDAFKQGFKPDEKWLDYYLECAPAVAAKSSHKFQKVVFLVVSDSELVGKAFVDRHPNHTILTATIPKHFSQLSDKSRDSLLRIVTDEIILSYPMYAMHSYSGFARLSAFVRGGDRRVRFMNSGCPDPSGKDLFFTSMDYMAGLWSLG